MCPPTQMPTLWTLEMPLLPLSAVLHSGLSQTSLSSNHVPPRTQQSLPVTGFLESSTELSATSVFCISSTAPHRAYSYEPRSQYFPLICVSCSPGCSLRVLRAICLFTAHSDRPGFLLLRNVILTLLSAALVLMLLTLRTTRIRVACPD